MSILQTKLREVYSTSALAFLREDPGYEYIRPFLECDIVNDGAFRSGGSAEVTDPITATVTEDRKKEENDVKVVSEAEAKITLYNAWGLLTQPAPKEWDPVTDWETSVMELMRDIKVSFSPIFPHYYHITLRPIPNPRPYLTAPIDSR